MSELIGRSKLLEELSNYENELRKDKVEAIETDDEYMLFAINNQETAICRIKRNIVNMPTAYDIDKVVEELECDRCESCNFLEVCAGSKCCGKCHEKAIEIVKQVGVSDDVCEKR